MDEFGAKPGEEHLFTEEAERDLIIASLKVCLREIEQYIRVYRQGMWRTVSQECLERHEKRVESIELLFWQRRNNAPF